VGVANTHFTVDDLPHRHAHRAPAESFRSKQFRAQLVQRPRTHALLTARDTDVIHPHQPGELDS
jgi:hypothetical protein